MRFWLTFSHNIKVFWSRLFLFLACKIRLQKDFEWAFAHAQFCRDLVELHMARIVSVIPTSTSQYQKENLNIPAKSFGIGCDTHVLKNLPYIYICITTNVPCNSHSKDLHRGTQILHRKLLRQTTSSDCQFLVCIFLLLICHQHKSTI